MAGACLLVACPPTKAQDLVEPTRAAFAHVRGTTPQLQALIVDTAQKSPAFRALVDYLEQSAIIVYVRTASWPMITLDARIGFLAGEGPRAGPRMLVIELSCNRPAVAQTAMLAHELRHAVEIADAPWVVDTVTLAQHYTRIGSRLDPVGGPVRFETAAAQETAALVRRELAAQHRVR